MKNFIASYYRFVIRHPWMVTALFCLVTGGMGYVAAHIKTDFNPNSFFAEADPDVTFNNHLREVFSDTDDLIYLTFKTRDVFTPEVAALMENLTRAVEKIDHITRVQSLTNTSYFLSTGEDGFEVGKVFGNPPFKDDSCARARKMVLGNPFFEGYLCNGDGTVSGLFIEVEEGYDLDWQRRVIQEELKRVARPFIGEEGKNPDPAALVQEWHLAGMPIIQATYLSLVTRDQVIFMSCVGLLFLVTLTLLFRCAVGVFAPVLVVAASNLWTLAAMVAMGENVTTVSSVVPTIISIYGIANAIHILLRYQEELGEGCNRSEAVVRSMTELTIACFMTSFTTFAGFISLLAAENPMISGFGLSAGVGVMIAWLVSIILLPPLILFFPSLPPRKVEVDPSDFLGRLLGRLSNWVPAHPKRIAVISGVLILLCLGASFWVVNDTFLNDELSESDPVTQAYRFAENNLSGMLPFELYLEAKEEGGLLEPQVMKAIEDATQFLHDQPDISNVLSLSTFLKAMNKAFHEDKEPYFTLPESRPLAAQYMLLYEMSGDKDDMLSKFVNETKTEARIWGLRYDKGAKAFFRLKEKVEQFLKTLPEGIDFKIVGWGLIFNKLMLRTVNDLFVSITSAFIVISLLLSLQFKSLRLGLFAMIPNVMPLIFTMGIMGTAGITLRTATVIIFSVSLGIAVDDTIHFLARYFEELEKRRDPVYAVQQVLRTSARAMVFASLLLVAGFSVLFLSHFRALFQFGLLMGVTVFAALLADLLVTPVLLLILKPGLTKEERAALKRSTNLGQSR